MIDSNLERLLKAAADGHDYPPAPELSDRVAAHLQPAIRRSGRAWGPAFSFAVLTGVLVLVALLAMAPARDAVARLFGVEGSRIEVRATALPGVAQTPLPSPQPLDGQLTAVAPADLASQLGFEPALPDIAAQPTGAFYAAYGGTAVGVLRYEAFDLWQAKLPQFASFGKLATSLPLDVEVNGYAGQWLTDEEHLVWYESSVGHMYMESVRTVDRNTLVWRTDKFFYRIETDLPLADTLRIAQTLP